MRPTEFRANLDLSSLPGASVDAYAQDDGYWHLFVALRFVGGNSLVFTTEEHSAGPRFEVFPIQVQPEVGANHHWRKLPSQFIVKEAFPLWRIEWIENGAVGPTVGANPATQYAGRGPAPIEALASARILAGVLLEGASGDRMVVAASDSAPFNVEVFLPGRTADEALKGFERGRVG